MFAPQKPEPRDRVEVFEWIRLKAGQKFAGWVAGPGFGLHTHFVGGSKACRKRLTGGALPCVYCSAHLLPVWSCFYPLYDAHGKRRAVALNEDYAPAADRVPHLYPVVVEKLTLWGSPLAMRQDDKRDPFPPMQTWQQKPLDVRPWLLQCWHDPELSHWVHQNPVLELPPQMPTGEDLATRVARKKEEQEEAERRRKAEAVDYELKASRARKRFHEINQEVQANGKHHSK